MSGGSASWSEVQSLWEAQVDSRFDFDVRRGTKTTTKSKDTVDGRNPAPVYRWFIPLFIGF